MGYFSRTRSKLFLIAGAVTLLFLTTPQKSSAADSREETIEAAFDAVRTEPAAKAIPLLEEAEKKYPFHSANSEILFQLGQAYLAEERYEDAKKTYDLLLTRYGKYADTLIRVDEAIVYRAKARGLMKEYDEAIAELKNFLRERPKSKARDDAFIELANIYLQQKNYADATKLLTPIAKDARSTARDAAMYLLAEITIQQGDVDKTEALMQNMLKTAKDRNARNQALYKLGDIYRDSSNFVKAINAYRRIKAVGDDREARELNAGILYEIGITYERLGHPLEARVAMEGLAFKYPELAASTVAWHRAVLNDADYGDFTRAEKTYLAYIKEHPGIPIANDVRLYFAQLLMQKNQFDDAIRQLKAGVQEYPTGVWAETSYHTLGVALLGAKRYEEAEATLQDFAKNFPDSPLVPDSYAFLAEGYIEQKQFTKAIEILKIIPTQFPDSEAAKGAARRGQEAYLLYGEFLVGSNMIDEAVAAYQNVTDPELLEQAVLLTGDAYVQGGRLDDAVSVLNTFIEQYPASEFLPQATFTLASAQMEAGEYEAAEATLQKLLDMNLPSDNPVLPSVQLQIAFCKYYRDDRPGMSNALASLTEKYPKSPEAGEALYWLGFLHRSNGNYPIAEDVYRKLVELYPDNLYAKEAAYLRGECFVQQNNTPLAIDRFKRVFDSYPDSAFGVYSLVRAGELSLAEEQLDAWLTELDSMSETKVLYSKEIQLAKAGVLMRAAQTNAAAAIMNAIAIDTLPAGIQGYALALKAGVANLQGQYAAAEALGQLAVEACATDGAGISEALYQLGQAYFHQQKWLLAEEAYRRMDEETVMPNNLLHALALINMAECLVKLDSADQVVDACDKAIRLRPGPELSARAVVLKGDAMTQMKDYQKAAQYYERAVVLYDGFRQYAVPAYKGLIESYQKLGLSAEATEAKNQFTERYPDAQ